MKPIIHVENLSKQYTIGAKAEPYSTLRESLVSAVRRPIDRMRRGGGKSADSQFWALKDVSFDVMPGEVVGIIGRNGAGKSTLLKILSRITEPTEGKVELFGRVGSLLEVGTGFHPELTGRENIFLNGAILGMRREEIAKKFDEIVDFAEIDEFLETPVKRYSSGMYVRLAFAVAAHLEPEILVVDEVLAVGDVQFQRKCLGKMSEVAKGGRTVMFVSHNMQAMLNLCGRTVYLKDGKVEASGETSAIIGRYHTDLEREEEEIDRQRLDPNLIASGNVRYVEWSITGASTGDPFTVFSRENVEFSIRLVCNKRLPAAVFGIVIENASGEKIIVGHSSSNGQPSTDLEPGIYDIRWRCDLPLKAGDYRIVAGVASTDDPEMTDEWRASPLLKVLPKLDNVLSEQWQGIVNVPVSVQIEKCNIR